MINFPLQVIQRTPLKMMDEEGFPLLQVDDSLSQDLDIGFRQEWMLQDCPCDYHNLTISRDEESGETTRQKVMVVRRPPEDCTSDTELELQLQALVSSQDLSPQALQSVYLNCMLPAYTLHQGCVHSALFDDHHALFSELSQHSPKARSDDDKMLTKKQPFRIPFTHSDTVSKKKVVRISIWQEFCRGYRVYDDTGMDWKELRKNCNLLAPLQFVFGDYLDLSVLPCTVLWLLRLLFIFLKCCYTPCVGLNIVYYHLLYNHVKIHQTGYERGIEPVFTGAVYQGPLIYSIRAISCPYCRQKRESKISMRYFESLRQERRSSAVR